MGMKFRSSICSYLTSLAVLLSVASSNQLSAATAPPLGTAQSFAVLGASTVTNTGSTVVTGDLGVSPGITVVGFPPGIVNGNIHAGDATAAQAQVDALTAYNFLAGQPANTNLSGIDLGGLTLGPGVYRFNSSAQLTGTLTLDAQGDPNAVFIFQTGSTLTTASSSSVVLKNGAVACNVFFQVGSSATLGTGTQFLGSIFANASDHLTTGTSLSGRVFALNGAVTLDTNQLSVCSGTLQVCKVAGAGVLPGTPFLFNVAGSPLTVAAGLPPAGTCSVPIVEPVGTVGITETLPPGVVLTSVATTPPGALVSSNLVAGTATVSVGSGALTTVTFTDALLPNTGFVQVCKVAGPGIIPGAPFLFNVAGNPLTVAAGPPPGGICSAPLVQPAGTVGITETIPLGVALTSVATSPPGALVSSNIGAGTATVSVTVGATTIVTFTDALLPNAGFVQVCKVAGSGLLPGTLFAFSVAGTSLTVAAGAPPGGTCSAPIVEPAGTVGITETIPPGVALISVATLPPGALVSSNIGAGTATVSVTAGAITIVTFTDALLPNTGFVQVCKIAGNGIALGAAFSFNVAGTPLTVAAGAPPAGTCSAPLVEPAGLLGVTETVPLGVVLTAVATAPPAALVSANLGFGTVILTVTAGATTIVTFTDALSVGPFPAPTDAFLIRYAANLDVGDSFIDFTNTGASSTVPFPSQNGNLCVNVYAFSPDEQLVSCCSCLVTPNGVASLSANNDLVNNTLTPGRPTSIVVKAVATAGTTMASCNAATAGSPANPLAPGLSAWGTTIHPLPVTPATPATTYGGTETPFIRGSLSIAELTRITALCGFIQTTGSGFGICKSCRLGGLGAVKE